MFQPVPASDLYDLNVDGNHVGRVLRLNKLTLEFAGANGVLEA